MFDIDEILSVVGLLMFACICGCIYCIGWLFVIIFSYWIARWNKTDRTESAKGPPKNDNMNAASSDGNIERELNVSALDERAILI